MQVIWSLHTVHLVTDYHCKYLRYDRQSSDKNQKYHKLPGFIFPVSFKAIVIWFPLENYIFYIITWHPRWMIGDWQECNKCPKGKRVRVVKCVRPTGEGEGETDIVSDYECAGPRPKEKESCICPKETKPIQKQQLPCVNVTKRMCNFTAMANSSFGNSTEVSYFIHISLLKSTHITLGVIAWKMSWR